MHAKCPSPKPAHETAFDAVAVDGEVVLIGARTSEALTPKAALVTAERIRKAAEQALREAEIPE